MKNTDFNTPMKLKSKFLLAAFIVVLFLGIGVSTQAQGIYNKNTDEKKANDTENTQSGETNGGIFRSGADGEPDEPGGPDNPIGEGILILSFLSGTYALVKRNLIRKHEIRKQKLHQIA